MGFIDSVVITVVGGNGGSTVIGFQGKTRTNRKLCVSYGGHGGSVWLVTDRGVNTLSYFIFKKSFFAEDGQTGRGYGCRGRSGKNIFIPVPIGTRVYNEDSCVIISDLVCDQQELMVVKGGEHGRLNSRIYYDKYGCCSGQMSSNYSRRIHGSSGERRNVRLELLLLADVGVLGLPNTGKSTFVRCVSSAKSKVGDYPFTTLVPSLGVVYVGCDKFVIADIPGLIKGASVGLGLGFDFLKHLQRCRMLLHFVDLVSMNNSEIMGNIKVIVHELQSYSESLAIKPMWLIFNKIDLLDKNESKKMVDDIVNDLKWNGRYYLISSKYNCGVKKLCYDLLKFIKCNR